MFEFTESERECLREMRALSTDSEGNEVLVGLTRPETIEYMAHARAFLTGDRDRENRERHLELHEKHERARFQVLGAEHYLRTNKPPIQ